MGICLTSSVAHPNPKGGDRDEYGDEYELHPTASRNTSERRRRSKTNSVSRPAPRANVRRASLSTSSSSTSRTSPPFTSEIVTPATPVAHEPDRSPSTRTTSLRAPLLASSSTPPVATNRP